MLGDNAMLLGACSATTAPRSGVDANLGDNATPLGNNAMLGDNTMLGDNNATLSNDAMLGNDTTLGDNAALRDDATHGGIAAKHCNAKLGSHV